MVENEIQRLNSQLDVLVSTYNKFAKENSGIGLPILY